MTNDSHSVLKRECASNYLMLLGFFLMGIASRLPFMSQMLYHWDSVNFALAIEEFDIVAHQPHPPGFILYVLLGRIASYVVHDPNAAYVLLSIFFSGCGAATVYLLGNELFDERTGIYASLLFITSPSVWFHGEIALTYTLDAWLVAFLVFGFWRIREGKNHNELLIWSGTMGLCGGFRLPSMVFLIPLYIYSIRKFPRKRQFWALSFTTLSTLAWIIPSSIQVGGLKRFIALIFNLSSLSTSASQRAFNVGLLFGSDSVIQPLGRLGMFSLYGLLAGFVPLFYLVSSAGLSWLGDWKKHVKDERIWFVVIWLLPFLLIWAPRVKSSGHTLSFIVFPILLAAYGLAKLVDRLGESIVAGRGIGYAFVCILLVLNMGFFLFAPPYLFGIQRVAFTTPSWSSIRGRDAYLSERIEYISDHFQPSTTAIMVSGVDFRHPSYYLREYPVIQYVEQDTPWSGQDNQITEIVVFSETLNSKFYNAECSRKTRLENGDLLYILDRSDDPR